MRTLLEFDVAGEPEGSKLNAAPRSPDQYRAIELLERIQPQHSVNVCLIAGEPPSKARPRFNARGRPYTPKRTIEGELRLATAFRDVPKFSGNLATVCIFFRSSRQRIDVDNLLKAVLDAGTRAAIWEDDSQVTALLGLVEYDRDNPRTIVAFGQHESTLTRGESAKVRCETCGELFFPAGHRRREIGRWCSRACRMRATPKTACEYCGALFNKGSGNQRFCSVPCRRAASKRYGTPGVTITIKGAG